MGWSNMRGWYSSRLRMLLNNSESQMATFRPNFKHLTHLQCGNTLNSVDPFIYSLCVCFFYLSLSLSVSLFLYLSISSFESLSPWSYADKTQCMRVWRPCRRSKSFAGHVSGQRFMIGRQTWERQMPQTKQASLFKFLSCLLLDSLALAQGIPHYRGSRVFGSHQNGAREKRCTNNGRQWVKARLGVYGNNAAGKGCITTLCCKGNATLHPPSWEQLQKLKARESFRTRQG